MPTAARLVSAVWFAAAGFGVAELYRLGVDPGVPMPRLLLLSVLCGAVCGWIILGSRAGRTLGLSLVFSIQTAALAIFWTLLIASVDRMFARAWNRLYSDPVDAVLGVFDLMWQALRQAAGFPEVVGAVIAATLVGAFLAHRAARRWR